MTKKIFIWVGHPRETSLSHGFADAYQSSAEAAGADVRRMNLSEMNFDADLTNGYLARKDLEPCLEEWRDNITWCEHTAWIYPYWWGGMPAKMKGVLDRAFLPGFAMNYHDNNLGWDKLLKGRTADVIISADAPAFYDTLRYGAPGRKQVKNLVLEFSGFKVRKMRHFGSVKASKDKKIRRWIQSVAKLGTSAANA